MRLAIVRRIGSFNSLSRDHVWSARADVKDSSAFNSLSRDHTHSNSLMIVPHLLSTPSLGITFFGQTVGLCDVVVRKLSTPSLGITRQPRPLQRVRAHPFNSLSRDHQIPLSDGQQERGGLSTPSLGITWCRYSPTRTSPPNFQLPLSGSRLDREASCSRYRENFQLPLSGSPMSITGTPSTSRKTFQLPLSGSPSA